MAAYFCRLLPPRASFAQDMTADEGALMQRHAGYWAGIVERGSVVAFGMVAAADGAFGVAIVDVDDRAAVDALTSADPVIVANAGFRYDVAPMPFGVLASAAVPA